MGRELTDFYLHVVSPVMAVATFLLAGHMAGVSLLSRFHISFRSTAERAAVSTTLGLGVLATAALLLGIAGGLTREGIVMLLLVTTFLFIATRGPTSPRLPRGFEGQGVAVAAMLLLLAPMVFTALYPPREWDTLHYHIPLALAHLKSGHIEPVLHLRYPVFPQLIEILFALPMAFSSDVAAQLMHAGLILLAALWVVAFGYRCVDAITGLWGAAIFLSFPIVAWLAGTGDIDGGLALFAAATAFSVLVWDENRESGWLTVAALSAGFMAGAKLTGLLSLGGLAFIVAWLAGRRLRETIRFAAIALVTAAPWYAYVAWHAHNPFWPAAQEHFGYWMWTPSDVAAQAKDVLQYGTKRTVASLLALPWRIAFRPERFDAVEAASWSALLVALTPLGLLARQRTVRLAAVLFILPLLVWFFTLQVLRYFVPALPVASFVAAWWLRKLAPRALLTPAAVALVALAILFPSARYAARAIAESGPLPLAAAARDKFVAARWPNYRVSLFVNKRSGTNATLFAIYGQNLNASIEGRNFGEVSGPWRYERVYTKLAGPESNLVSELRAMGVNYLMVSVSEFGWGVIARWPEWTMLRPVYGDGFSALFQVEDEPLTAVASAEPVAVGRVISSGESLALEFPVTPEQVIDWTIRARDVEPTGHVAVRVEWRDEHFQSLEVSELKFPIVGKMSDAKFFLSAPPGSRTARLVASPDGHGSIEIESVLASPAQYRKLD